MAAPSFSATIVTYRTPADTVARALRSLAAAVCVARAEGWIADAHVHVVDNSPADAAGEAAMAVGAWDRGAGAIELHAGHGNVGYGRANNLVLPHLRSATHLVMNPDVELERGALAAALRALDEQPEVGMVAPAVFAPGGERQFLCKRYPSVR